MRVELVVWLARLGQRCHSYGTISSVPGSLQMLHDAVPSCHGNVHTCQNLIPFQSDLAHRFDSPEILHYGTAN